MATIKSYTDLEQSKKLAEILPIESADMWWNFYSVTTDDTTPQIIHLDTPWVGNFNWDNKPDNIPCWSLAALHSVLPIIGEDQVKANPFIAKTPAGEYYVVYATLYKEIDSSGIYSNPVDACVEVILRLHEQNLL